MKQSGQNGFSLVELSIVLVILGLLTGGILTGQSLIRAAELRAVTTEYAQYTTALNSFRDKYFAMPGDMNNATKFWGTDPDGCPTHTVHTSKQETCDGNGDGTVSAPESYRAWQQLANAGLIEGSYSGVAHTGGGSDHTAGINCPTSKYGSTGGWQINWISNAAGAHNAAMYQHDYSSGYLLMGGDDNSHMDFQLIRTEDAWNIDTKMDDGLSGSGRVHNAWYRTTCTDSVSGTDYTAAYKLSAPDNRCALLFKF